MLKKRAAALLILCILFANLVFVTKSEDIPEWTFMVYLDGDNNLENFGIDDFLEMAEVGSSYDLQILVQFDRISGDDNRYGDWTDAKRFLVEKGMEPIPSNAVQSLGEVDMADPNVLYDFLNWSANNYEAKKYFLVIWDHGLGWEGIVRDDTSGGYMKTPELAGALAQFNTEKGRKIDIVAFDACRMMLEMIYEMRNYAHYFVGSEKDVPDRGFPYDMLLNGMASNPLIPVSSASKILVDVYVNFYTQNTIFAVTLSSVKASSLGELEQRLNALLNETRLELPYYSEEIKNAREATEYYDDKPLYYHRDLYHFMENLQSEVSSRRLNELAEDVKTVIEDNVYERKWDNPSSANTRCTNAHGLSIWLPLSVVDFNYLNLQFAIDTYWDEFLDLYNINFDKPQASLEISFTATDEDINGYNDTISLNILANITGNLTVDFYSDTYQFSKYYDLTAGVPKLDTITLSNNGYYTLHFYLTNTTGHLQNYSELINPLSSYVDLAIDSQNISIEPHPNNTTIGNIEVISALITLYGPLDALGINVSFYTSQKTGGESPDENNDGLIDASYSGTVIGWKVVDIYADLNDFEASGVASIIWDTSLSLGENDIWVIVDYPSPGKSTEADGIYNNKARYWQGNFYVVKSRIFCVCGKILDDNGNTTQLDMVLTNMMSGDTISTAVESSTFEISFLYPLWAQDDDVLELKFNYSNEEFKYQFEPDFKKSSYTINILLKSSQYEEERGSFLPVFLIQLLGIVIALIGFKVVLRQKRK